MGDNYTPQLREQSSYGYWISARGGIINVEQKDGHISLLMDRDEFIDLSPTQPYSTWYETALLRGWVRIIAPVANRQQFRFQFRELSPDTRTPLIWLIGSLMPYREYILEASTYKVFYSPQDTSRYIEQCCGPVGGFSTASWTTSSTPGVWRDNQDGERDNQDETVWGRGRSMIDAAVGGFQGSCRGASIRLELIVAREGGRPGPRFLSSAARRR